MNLKHILLFGIFIAFFSCSTEPTDNPEEEEISTTSKRVKEAIGYSNNIEIAKMIYNYSDDKLVSVVEYKKENNNWVEVSTYQLAYNGNSITGNYIGSDSGSYNIYATNNGNIISISEFYENDNSSGYKDITFTNDKISTYTFYEGSSSTELYSYKSNCIYENGKVVTINEEHNNYFDTTYIEYTSTNFNYTGDSLTGWIYEIIEYQDEKVEHQYSNNLISKSILSISDNNLNDWKKASEFSYLYDSDGYLIEESYIDFGNKTSESHLYDDYFFETDTDKITYTYEEGIGNSFILLYPEFVSYQTPNPHSKY
ncbi:hypothetical protein [Mariniflexile sp. HMF6888]|uniref:hypothetical protein n=1 Tax=Mariniflexile sp. HMF6888 TaxID=3373086 RepID=UPI0037908B87